LQPLDFSWEKREWREAVVRFLFVGRLTKRKGLHIVLEAWGVSRNDWILDVVGATDLKEPNWKSRHNGSL
jgi:glycosyltransferase involved in cell wall biosynthesis